MKTRTTIDCEFSGEASFEEIREVIHEGVNHLCNNGLITGEIAAFLEELKVTTVLSEPAVYRGENGAEFLFNDVVECMTAGLPHDGHPLRGRLVQVRIGCGQFGSDIFFIRRADGELMTVQNDCLIHPSAGEDVRDFPKGPDTPESTYSINFMWPETGFIVENPAQPEEAGSFAMTVDEEGVGIQCRTETEQNQDA